MHTICKKDLCKVLRVSLHGARLWLGDADFVVEGSKYLYRLPDVVAAARANRKRGLNSVEARGLIEIDRVRRADEDAVLHVGEGARQRAHDVTRALTLGEAERLKLAQAQFTGSLVENLLDRAVFEHLDDLRDILILSPEILAFVLTGDAAMLPVWRHFAPAFAVVNVPETTTKEAA